MATPSFSANQTRVPIGSPIEVTYKFVVAKDAPKIGEDFRVFVHFLDADNERLWTDDHDLPVPTSQWKPGQTIEYTKTMFVPIVPYEGATKVLMGLYSNASDSRLPLAGTVHDRRSYVVGTARSPETHRRHLRDVQGGLACGRNAARQPGRGMAVDEERRDPVGEKSEEGRDALPAS